MQMSKEALEIRNTILGKDLSLDDLEGIKAACIDSIRWRKQRKAEKMGRELSPGDRVRIREDAQLRPRYILGTEAQVIRTMQRNAEIRLGVVVGGQGRFHTNQVIRCPMEALEIIEEGS